jgi:hypothetical protein
VAIAPSRILGLDGSNEALWTGSNRYFFRLARGPDGTIYGDLKDMRIEVLIYERGPS